MEIAYKHVINKDIMYKLLIIYKIVALVVVLVNHVFIMHLIVMVVKAINFCKILLV